MVGAAYYFTFCVYIFYQNRVEKNKIDFRLTPTYSYMSFPKMKTEDCTQIWFNLCLCIKTVYSIPCLNIYLLTFLHEYVHTDKL